MILDRLGFLRKKTAAPSAFRDLRMDAFQDKYLNFKVLLDSNSELLKIISDIEEKLRGETSFGSPYIEAQTIRAVFHSSRMIQSLESVSGRSCPELSEALEAIHQEIKRQQGVEKPVRLSDFTLAYCRIDRRLVDSVGEKNANIGEVRNRVGLPVPEGFAITTAAFEAYLEANRLSEEIRRLKIRVDVISPETVMRASTEIQERILSGNVPDDLERAIRFAYDTFVHGLGEGKKDIPLSMRSSAIGEDSVLSFAGQYLTVLNVPPENIIEEYKKILASIFSSRALSYRLHMGVPFQESAMAVACQEMIPAAVSGVMYTANPVNPLDNRIVIDAVWGLGPYAVDGVVTPDHYTITRGVPPVVAEMKISEKTFRMVTRAGGYTAEEAVEDEIRCRPCLSEDQIRTLAGYGMRLEDHYQCPQDVEWALDDKGRMVILQARPLRMESPGETEAVRPLEAVAGYPVLLKGGDIVCPGVGSGPVFPVRTEEDLIRFPEGGILVASHSSPQFVMVMEKARGIVTDTGNVTGHMAALAREYMIPTVLNTKTATELLSPGMEVTVDAYSARVYAGRVPGLAETGIGRRGFLKNTPLYRALRKRADLIVPLNLVDPKSPSFCAQSCRTIHDIMRLVHERSYAEIFQMGDLITDHGKISKRLMAPLPLDLYVIDIGKGVEEGEKPGKTISVDGIVSVPFKALLRGMLREDLRNRGPIAVEFKGFLSVLGRQMLSPPNLPVERFGDRSYAIVSDKYLNFSSRVGYHYSVLDAYCGKTSTKNYINFQFKGGAADDIRRGRRARLIQKILYAAGFLVETIGDRVTARFSKHQSRDIEERLDQIGRLLMYTRQMDMLMHSDECIARMSERFLNGDYRIDE